MFFSAPLMRMSLRPKIYSLAISGILLGIVVLYIVSRLIVIDGYQRLDEQSAQLSMRQVLNAVTDELTTLERTNSDWAYWDDTYEYLETRNPAYVQSNLTGDVLAQLHLSIIVLLDADAHIVLEKATDAGTGDETSLPDGLAESLQADSPLLQHQNPTDAVSGLIMLKNGPMLVASHAVLPTDEQGPSRGTLVIGRLLDASEIDTIARRTEVVVSSRTIGLDTLTEDFQIAHDALTQMSAPLFVRPLNEDQVASYAISPDLFGKALVLWRVERPRDGYHIGQTTVNYFLISLMIIGLLFTVLMLLMVDRFFLSPVAYLHRSVTRIHQNDATEHLIVLPGQDELSQLATAINAMVIDLNAAQLSLQQSLQFKSDILANVSHDARSPLSTIKLRAEMLQLGMFGPLNPQQQQSIESIQASADQLLFFVNNLLDASHLESRRVTLNRETFEPAALLRNVVESMTIQAEEKQLQLTSTLLSDVAPTVVGDPERLTQILTNLIGNAIKFTDKGKVTVSLCQPDATHLRIEVADTGRGIKPEQQARIFEAFYQVDRSMTRRHRQGVGLGLSIVKQLVGLMDGSITVQSSVDVGTTFTVHLPLNSDKDPSL